MDKTVLFQLIAALVQVLVVLALVAAVWLIFGRKRHSFRTYTGLYPATFRVTGAAVVIGSMFPIILLLIPSSRELASGPNTIVGEVVAQLGRDRAIFVLLIIAIFKTAFAEELLFRGLIGKRLIHWLGFSVGNAIQAGLFGSIHLLLLPSAQSSDQQLASGLAILTVTALGWINGWLNERFGRGSILPGWTVHAVANVITYLTIALWIV